MNEVLHPYSMAMEACIVMSDEMERCAGFGHILSREATELGARSENLCKIDFIDYFIFSLDDSDFCHSIDSFREKHLKNNCLSMVRRIARELKEVSRTTTREVRLVFGTPQHVPSVVASEICSNPMLGLCVSLVLRRSPATGLIEGTVSVIYGFCSVGAPELSKVSDLVFA